MQIGDMYSVITPEDSRHKYDTDWRHGVAKAMVDSDSVTKALADDDVYVQTAYLRYTLDPDMTDILCDMHLDECLDNMLMQVHAANVIHGKQGVDCSKDRIEALLLCPELTYADISRAFNLPAEVVRMYERLFFNVRDNDGKTLPCKGLLQYFALKGQAALTDIRDYATHWRLMAFESGHGALLNAWGWPEGDIVPTFTDYESSRHLLRLSFSRVEAAIRTGVGLDSRSFAGIFESINAKFSEYRDKGMLSGAEKLTPEYLVLQVLEMMAPELLAPSESRTEERKRALGDRITALKNTAGAEDSETKSFEFIDVQNIEGK
jgi:hypothetical protein